MKKKAKTDDDKRRERESKILNELSGKHGYLLEAAPVNVRTTMMMTRLGSGKAKCEAGYRVYVVVPGDSALGVALAKHYEEIKPKAKRRTTDK